MLAYALAKRVHRTSPSDTPRLQTEDTQKYLEVMELIGGRAGPQYVADRCGTLVGATLQLCRSFQCCWSVRQAGRVRSAGPTTRPPPSCQRIVSPLQRVGGAGGSSGGAASGAHGKRCVALQLHSPPVLHASGRTACTNACWRALRFHNLPSLPGGHGCSCSRSRCAPRCPLCLPALPTTALPHLSPFLAELTVYKSNLIKESIRMGHTQLGDFFYARGDLQVCRWCVLGGLGRASCHGRGCSVGGWGLGVGVARHGGLPRAWTGAHSTAVAAAALLKG